MPNISERGQQMPASPIRKLVPYAEAAKKRGIKVYHLNIGQPDIKTPEVALEAIRKYDGKVIEYSHSAGNESYRKALAANYCRQGIMVDHNQILITTGGSEAILFAMFSCLNPGDEIIIPEPFYTNYNAFALTAGVTVKPITSNIKDGFALPPIAEFEKSITPKTKAIMVCNPNNPTGYLYSNQELLQLRDLVLKHDLYLFADEVYREFCYDGIEHFSVMKLDGLDNHVVMVDSVSKRYSECGVRIGALITRNTEILNSALKYAQARLSPPSLGQVVGEASLQTPYTYFKEVYDEPNLLLPENACLTGCRSLVLDEDFLTFFAQCGEEDGEHDEGGHDQQRGTDRPGDEHQRAVLGHEQGAAQEFFHHRTEDEAEQHQLRLAFGLASGFAYQKPA